VDVNISGLMIASFIIPAAVLFYSSLRTQNYSNRTYVLSFGALIVVVLTWVFIGWSMAFGPNDLFGIISDPISAFIFNYAFKEPIIDPDAITISATSVDMIKLSYEMIFPILGAIFIAGVIEHQIRLMSFCAYIGTWVIFFYAPMTHIARGGGLLSEGGALDQLFKSPVSDFNGGLALLIGSSISAIVLTSILNRSQIVSHRRRTRHSNRLDPFLGNETRPSPFVIPKLNSLNIDQTLENSSSSANPPTVQFRQTFAMFGLFMLIASWLCLNTATVSNLDSSAVGIIWVVSLLIISSSVAAWFIIEKILVNSITQGGMILSTLCGLACSSAIANAVSPSIAIVVGILTSTLTFFCAALVKKNARRTTYVDYISVILFGGIFGLVFGGIFGTSGWIATGGPGQLIAQIIGIVIAVIYSFLVSLFAALIINKTVGFRTNPD
jgi:Amt family ammonium transporter